MELWPLWFCMISIICFLSFFACVRSMLLPQGSLENPTFLKTEGVYFFYGWEQIKEACGANLFN